MAKPATKSATLDLRAEIVSEMKGVFTNAGLSDPDARVFTEDTPYDLFPHAIVFFPDEGRSLPTEDKGSAPVVNFPQVNIYQKGTTGAEDVGGWADDIMQRVTGPSFSVSGWNVRFNRLQFNQRNSTSAADEETVFSRAVQFQIHLEST